MVKKVSRIWKVVKFVFPDWFIYFENQEVSAESEELAAQWVWSHVKPVLPMLLSPELATLKLPAKGAQGSNWEYIDGLTRLETTYWFTAQTWSYLELPARYY